MFLALIALGGFGAGLAAVIVRYQHRLLRSGGMGSPAAQQRGGVRWQVGRWDSDPRHIYVANLGDDIAYEVEVAEDQKVLATAPSVPPYSASPRLGRGHGAALPASLPSRRAPSWTVPVV
jgi:hypothetical protein